MVPCARIPLEQELYRQHHSPVLIGCRWHRLHSGTGQGNKDRAVSTADQAHRRQTHDGNAGADSRAVLLADLLHYTLTDGPQLSV